MRGTISDLTTPAARRLAEQVNGAHTNGTTYVEQPQMFTAPPRVKPPAIALPPGSIGLGLDEHDRPFGIDLGDLLAGRLLIQGNSGAGKSWIMRKLLEESSGMVQQIILDPENEFRSLAEHCDYPVVQANKIDMSGGIVLAGRLRKERQSIVIDMSELERDRQMMFVASFLPALIEAPQEHWHSAIVAIDEAHLFAPLGGQGFEGPMIRKRSVSAVVDLMSRGRKRGLSSVLATQRFARMNKSVVAEAHNFLIGINTLDLDIRRAAETIGWDANRAFDRLPLLKPGEFVAVGPAFVPDSPLSVRIGFVRSHHTGGSPAIGAPVLHGAEGGAELLGLDNLEEEGEADQASRDRGLPSGTRALREFICDANAPLATRVFAELKPLYPEGSTIQSLALHFATTVNAISRAVALLGSMGAIDTLGNPGPGLGVRMSKSMTARKGGG